MPESHQIGRKTKSHQNTSNDSPQHTQIRRGSIRLSITGNPQKTRTQTKQRVKVSPWTNLNQSKIDQREKDYPNHHKPKTTHSTLLRRPKENRRICVQTGNT
jgi:hypothetical protein